MMEVFGWNDRLSSSVNTSVPCWKFLTLPLLWYWNTDITMRFLQCSSKCSPTVLSYGLSGNFPVLALRDTSAHTLKHSFFFFFKFIYLFLFSKIRIVITFHCLCVLFEAMKLLSSDFFFVIFCHWECNIQSLDCASLKILTCCTKF
jgi:hypothetical protein